MSRDGAISRRRATCRVCGGKELVPFLDLGLMPLVNRYLNSAAGIQDEPRFPLEIHFCRSCSLSQLSVVVDAKILYSEYDYHSSVSRTFQRHCGEMAASLKRDLSLGSRDLVVEIASNDGCLVSKFQKLGCRVLGVEPAVNLAKLASDAGIPTLHEFWSQAAADRIRKEHGPARLVVATNVVAHVDDLHGFFRAVASLIQSAGAFVFEVPYMVNFMNRAEFDTAYHEHLSYFLLRPLKRALEENGLALLNAQEFEIHGGSIRVTARPAESGAVPSDRVQRLLGWEEELGLHEEATYLRFASHVAVLKEELTAFVHALKARGKKLAAYGASAKGNVLLNYCGIGKDMLEYVVDDTPAKQGKLYPGNHLPIVSRDRLKASPPDYLLLLAWNFVDEMVQNTAEYRAQGGRYIVPIPSLRVI
jgi:hypothetical protein